MMLTSKTLIIAACGFSIVLIGSCNLKDAGEKAGKSAEQSTENLKQGLNALSEGMKGIDPIALKQILNENKALRDQVVTLTGRLQGGIPGSGVIEIGNRKVRMVIVRYTGSHRLNGWLDDPANWFWQNRGLDDKDIVLDWRLPTTIEQAFTNRPDRLYVVWMPHLGQVATNRATEVFNNFLRDSAIIPGPDFRSIDLNTRFGSTGDHTIALQVTPVKADRNGRWSVRAEIVLESQDGQTKEYVASVDLDSDTYPGHGLGTPLPVVYLPVRVKTVTGQE